VIKEQIAVIDTQKKELITTIQEKQKADADVLS
jgi:hypothetical protein